MGVCGQVDFHRMPVENCPVGTPGCAKPRWAQQADHQIVLATDGRPRNYVYNYFTDEADSANDLGQVVFPPRFSGVCTGSGTVSISCMRPLLYATSLA